MAPVTKAAALLLAACLASAAEDQVAQAGSGHAANIEGVLEVLTLPEHGGLNLSTDILLAQLAERLGASANKEGVYSVPCARVEALPQLAVLSKSGRALALSGRDYVVRDGSGGCRLAARGLGCMACKAAVNLIGIGGAGAGCLSACRNVGASWPNMCGAACGALATGMCHGGGRNCAQMVCEHINMCTPAVTSILP